MRMQDMIPQAQWDRGNHMTPQEKTTIGSNSLLKGSHSKKKWIGKYQIHIVTSANIFKENFDK
jgi:hypothetical protein